MRFFWPTNTGSKVSKAIFLGLALLFVFSSQAFAQEGGDEPTLYEPIEKQIIQLSDESGTDGWHVSELETYGVKFLVRAKAALTWSLNITDGGFHNPAIETTYAKVLTIVNSLFILGLLAIAAMWMFSILIPRKQLKKVMLVYGMAVVFVNFALPVNQLLIDGSNILQRTLLVDTEGQLEITDIVQTPDYLSAVSYKTADPEGLIDQVDQEVELSLSSTNPATEAVATLENPLNPLENQTLNLNGQTIQFSSNRSFDSNQEQVIFRFLIVIMTALAYFLMALIFVLRIVILWALLILSPALLVLGIFKSTRSWFFNWLSIYGRWILIGPLIAIGLSMVVNIWQVSGLPIEVDEAYVPEVFSNIKNSNITFYLPGKDTPNTLQNTSEMMEYVVFLLMIYLPIIASFILTGRKRLVAGGSYGYQKIVHAITNNQSTGTVQPLMWQPKPENDRPNGIVNNVKHLVNENIIKLTGAASSLNKLKTEQDTQKGQIETASDFLPETLKKKHMSELLELTKKKETNTSRKEVIQKLSRLEDIKDKQERKNTQKVLKEIAERSLNGNKEASELIREVEHEIKQSDNTHSESFQTIENVRSSMSSESIEYTHENIQTISIEKNNEKEVSLKKDKQSIEVKRNKPAETKSDKNDENENDDDKKKNESSDDKNISSEKEADNHHENDEKDK